MDFSIICSVLLFCHTVLTKFYTQIEENIREYFLWCGERAEWKNRTKNAEKSDNVSVYVCLQACAVPKR